MRRAISQVLLARPSVSHSPRLAGLICLAARSRQARFFHNSNGYRYSEKVQGQASEVNISSEELARADSVVNAFQQNLSKLVDQVAVPNEGRRVLAFSISDTFDLTAIQLELQKYGPKIEPQIMQQKKKRKGCGFMVLRVTQDSCAPRSDPKSPFFLTWNGVDKDYLFFDDGAVVCWGTSASDHSSLEALLKFYSNGHVTIHREEMLVELGTEPGLDPDRDTIRLTKSNPATQLQEKLAFSIALSRSVKLDDIELDVEKAVSKAQSLDFGTLQKGGDGQILGALSRNELANLYQIKYKMTVRSRLMEDPAYFWDKPTHLYTLYSKLDQYLDIDSRVENVQEKLELPTTYWNLEHQHSAELMSWRLEWMIIIIIALELFLALLSKSKTWKDWTFEDLFSTLAVRLGLKAPQPKKPYGDDYEIVEEVYEVIDDGKKKRIVKPA